MCIQRDTFKSTIDKAKWNSKRKKGTSNPKEGRRKQRKETKCNQKPHWSPSISIITLHVNVWIYQLKEKNRVDKKQDPTICSPQETQFKINGIGRLKVKRWQKICNANINQKKAVVATLMSDKVDSRAKKITRVREGHFIILKGSGYQEDIAILNLYVPNNRAAK